MTQSLIMAGMNQPVEVPHLEEGDMIVVTVTLHSALDGRKEVLAESIIFNDGSGTRTKGNYKALAIRKNIDFRDGKDKEPGWLKKHVIREGEVKGYNRISEHVWNLVAQALAAMGYK